jgi:hypothetical protein
LQQAKHLQERCLVVAKAQTFGAAYIERALRRCGDDQEDGIEGRCTLI